MNKLFKLATGHYLIVHADAPMRVVPVSIEAFSEMPANQAKHLRAVADEIEAADRHIAEQSSAPRAVTLGP